MDKAIDLEHISLFVNAFKNAPIGMALVAPDGRWLMVNHSLCKLLGYSEDELTSTTFQAITHIDDLYMDLHYISQLLEGKIDKYKMEKRYIHKLGYTVWTLLSVSLVTGANGAPLYFVTQIIDITERKIAESVREILMEQLRENEESLRLLIEESPEAVIIAKSGSIIYVNEAGLQLLGAARLQQVIGKPVFDFMHEDFHEIERERMERVKLGQTVDLINEIFVRLDGEPIEVEVKAMPIIYGDEPAQYIVAKDVTELKKSREMLKLSEKLSIAGKLAAGIAHEIRNPLTALKGFLQLLRAGSTEKQEYFDIMASELNRIEFILNELLMLAKPKDMTLKPEYLHQLLNHTITLLETQAIMNNVQIVTDFTQEELVFLCDENNMKQVFINIMKNAIEAMPNGGMLTIETMREENKAVIRFTDTGCGIDEAKLAKLGQPFYTTKEQGTGLGLMVTYSIIENHRGSLSVASKLNEGSTFSIELPLFTVIEPPAEKE